MTIIICMRLGRRRSIAVGLTLGAAALVVPHLLGSRWQTDEELSSRIEREKNPVKKAKFEIRLGRLKLNYAVEACVKDDHPRCHGLFGSFLTLMKCRWLLALSMLAAFVAPVAAHPQKHATLSDEEENKLRDAQDPGERIGIYLELEQVRLSKFESGRAAANDPKYDYESYFSALL